jgi:S1-C subfamily serine protease
MWLRCAYLTALACAMLSPAAVGEERSWEIRGAFVKLKEGRPDVVVLRTSSGDLIEVPLVSLSEADRGFVSRASPSVPAEGEASTVIKGPLGRNFTLSVPAGLVAVETDAVYCRTAAEAVQIYRIFLAKEDLPASMRKAGDARLEHWRKLAAENRVRLGEKWIPLAERDDIARRADDMVRHARELLRLGQFKLAGDELRKASKLDPESGKADFFLGWVYSLGLNDDDKAVDHFREVIRREPSNPWAYSNLAVSELFANQSGKVVEHFQKALENIPQPQVVADNIGIALALVARRSLRLPDKPLNELGGLYRRAIREMNLKPLSDSATLHLTYISPFGKAWEGRPDNAASGGRTASELPEDAVVEIGTGTGFVVAPGYVVTNHHVIDGADSVTILDPADRTSLIDASIVAVMVDSDLALLKCVRLKAPALPLRRELPRRGTDVMVLGFPGVSLLGLELKTTRGSVVSNADPVWDGRFLHSATINKGNSGGPIVDAKGAVVGVVVAYTRREVIENTYSLGIPIDAVWSFLAAHLPDLEPAEDLKDLSWPEVDERVSPGTVFVQVKRKRPASE